MSLLFSASRRVPCHSSSDYRVAKIVAGVAAGTLALVFLSPILLPVEQPNLAAPTPAPRRTSRAASRTARAPIVPAAARPTPRPLKVAPSLVPTERPRNDDGRAAIALVGAAVGDNVLQVSAADLLSAPNSKGAGTIVYVAQDRFGGVKRDLVWMVIEGRAFALNGPSKETTPGLPWPGEAAESLWAKTGIDPFSGAQDAVEMVR